MLKREITFCMILLGILLLFASCGWNVTMPYWKHLYEGMGENKGLLVPESRLIVEKINTESHTSGRPEKISGYSRGHDQSAFYSFPPGYYKIKISLKEEVYRSKSMEFWGPGFYKKTKGALVKRRNTEQANIMFEVKSQHVYYLLLSDADGKSMLKKYKEGKDGSYFRNLFWMVCIMEREKPIVKNENKEKRIYLEKMYKIIKNSEKGFVDESEEPRKNCALLPVKEKVVPYS